MIGSARTATPPPTPKADLAHDVAAAYNIAYRGVVIANPASDLVGPLAAGVFQEISTGAPVSTQTLTTVQEF